MKIIITTLTFILFSQFAFAAKVNFSLTPDIALIKKSENVELFSLGFWSENPQTAFTLGFVNGSTGSSKGFSLAIIANYSDDYVGGQLAIANWSKGHITGAQIGAVNFTEKLTGLQFGLFNYAKSIKNGIQIGLVNYVPQTTEWFAALPNQVAPLFPFFNWRFE